MGFKIQFRYFIFLQCCSVSEEKSFWSIDWRLLFPITNSSLSLLSISLRFKWQFGLFILLVPFFSLFLYCLWCVPGWLIFIIFPCFISSASSSSFSIQPNKHRTVSFEEFASFPMQLRQNRCCRCCCCSSVSSRCYHESIEQSLLTMISICIHKMS